MEARGWIQWPLKVPADPKASLPSLPTPSSQARLLSASSQLCPAQVRVELPEGAGGEGTCHPVVSSPAEMFLSRTSDRISKMHLIVSSFIYSFIYSPGPSSVPHWDFKHR